MDQHQQLVDALNPPEERLTGECVKWKNEAGYGFIRQDNGDRDLFCHIKWLPNCVPLVVGERVSYKLGTDPNGRPTLYEVRLEPGHKFATPDGSGPVL
jgi:cold shock CspA family protein